MNRKTWGIAILLCLFSAMSNAGELKAITSSEQQSDTVLFFAIEGAFKYKFLVLNKPYRIVLDLTNTKLAVNVDQLHLNAPFIKQVRSGHPNSKTLRLVVDVTKALRVKTFLWQEKGVTKGLKMKLVQKAGLKKIRKIESASKKQPIKVAHKPSSSQRTVVVVIDAGHGGKDPGARGPHRSKEKDIVLSIALKLKQLINKQPGMRAVLTRSGDYYVGLRERLEIARKYNGDIFVSIHADAFNNPRSQGASVFALSQRGATSEAARWIAEKENYSELGGVDLEELDDQNGVVRSVLIDLSQTSTINSSLEMGRRVLGELNTFTNLHNGKVEQARFVVLKSPDIPSVLVETGFISNPKEERNLMSYAYQMRLSQAIFNGIKSYFWDNPPHGTRIEAIVAKS